MKKPYMPLMMGDWLMMTSGLRADAKGVIVELLIHQYHHGRLPEPLDDLTLIQPQVGSVWVMIEHLFPVTSLGSRHNPELEETRAFWAKQAGNGKLGGRPKKEKPEVNPNNNPDINPKHNHHNDLDLDLDTDLVIKLDSALDEIYLGNIRSAWKHINFDIELLSFRQKVIGNPGDYQNRTVGQLRNALQSQLRSAKHKTHGNSTSKKDQQLTSLVIGYAERHGK